MKAIIDKEGKERFFGLYINQRVLADNLRSNERLDKSWNWRHDGFWLNLKPLSELSDEDAIEVAKIVGGYDDPVEWGKNIVRWYFIEGHIPTGISVPIIIDITDYLRSKGYAIRHGGYTVEELNEAGLCKFQKP